MGVVPRLPLKWAELRPAELGDDPPLPPRCEKDDPPLKEGRDGAGALKLDRELPPKLGREKTGELPWLRESCGRFGLPAQEELVRSPRGVNQRRPASRWEESATPEVAAPR